MGSDAMYLIHLLTEEDRHEEKMIFVYTMINAIQNRKNLSSRECDRGHIYLCAGRSLRFKCVMCQSTIADWCEIRKPNTFFELMLLKDTYTIRDIRILEKCIRQVTVNKRKEIGKMGGNSTLKAKNNKRRRIVLHPEDLIEA